MTITNSVHQVRIGNRIGSLFWVLNGVLDNVRISSVAYEYAAVPVCGDPGTLLPGDISGPEGRPDCLIDMYDLQAVGAHWLEDTMPTGPAPAAFFSSAPDTASAYDPEGIYPEGQKMMFSLYSVSTSDLAAFKADGFNTVGPYYGAGNLSNAEAHGLKYIEHVGMSLDPADFVLPSDSEIQAAITAQVSAAAGSESIIAWNLHPEELQPWEADQMHYLQVASAAVRAADPLGRPIWMYEPNHRTAAQLAQTGAYQDWCAKGMYTNSTGHKTERIWCKWGIEQELAAIAALGGNAVAMAMPEMFEDPAASEFGLIFAWARHDLYLSLITGARGVNLFSGWSERPGFTQFDTYYDAYRSVVEEINGDLGLGKVLLFGEPRSDIAVTVTGGPATVSVTSPAYTAASINCANLADADGARYLILVNSADSSVTADISGLPVGTIWKQELFVSAAYQELTGGSFSTTFAPLEVKAFRFVHLPHACGDEGTVYSAGDVSGPAGVPDCVVNLLDFAALAQAWLECSEPNPNDCL